MAGCWSTTKKPPDMRQAGTAYAAGQPANNDWYKGLFVSDLESGEFWRPGRKSRKVVEQREPDPLPEDTDGLFISCLVRDTELLAQTGDADDEMDFGLKIARLVVSIILIALVCALQVFLLLEVWVYVSQPAVHNIRSEYNNYEYVMYGSDMQHVVVSGAGRVRGIATYWNSSNFGDLSDEHKAAACNVPMSQPAFLIEILFIWALTCIASAREPVGLILRLLCVTPTIGSMKNSTEHHNSTNALVVIGLTREIKFLLSSLLTFRIVVTFVLLVLGMRWLTATVGFQDVLLNAVALEFILMLKDLLYNALAPARNKRDTQNTYIMPMQMVQHPSYFWFLGSYAWVLIALVWVSVYVFAIQRVVFDYRWDQQSVCTVWKRAQAVAGYQGDNILGSQ